MRTDPKWVKGEEPKKQKKVKLHFKRVKKMKNLEASLDKLFKKGKV